MADSDREIPSLVDDAETRAFIAGWNARLDHADFDMALHHWMLASVVTIGTPPILPHTGETL